MLSTQRDNIGDLPSNCIEGAFTNARCLTVDFSDCIAI